MQHHPAMPPVRSIVDKVSNIRKWITKLSISQEQLGNHSICPFAATANVHIQEVEVGDIAPVPGVDVAIFIVSDTLTLHDLEDLCERLNSIWVDYVFLDDHKDDPSYINGIQSNYGESNLILVQRKDKLMWAREQLKKSDYYHYWSKEMYNKIVKG